MFIYKFLKVCNWTLILGMIIYEKNVTGIQGNGRLPTHVRLLLKVHTFLSSSNLANHPLIGFIPHVSSLSQSIFFLFTFSSTYKLAPASSIKKIYCPFQLCHISLLSSTKLKRCRQTHTIHPSAPLLTEQHAPA